MGRRVGGGGQFVFWGQILCYGAAVTQGRHMVCVITEIDWENRSAITWSYHTGRGERGGEGYGGLWSFVTVRRMIRSSSHYTVSLLS